MTKNTGCRIRGTHTRVAPEFSPRTTASATCDGVLDIGAGDIPSVTFVPSRPISLRLPRSSTVSRSSTFAPAVTAPVSWITVVA